ncbi:MAG: dihydrodipicolinate synthase family protein [Chloroflexi bacterium]|nr:dihydrodipicolinate synthase family protein [Chloroflexota bacterium]
MPSNGARPASWSRRWPPRSTKLTQDERRLIVRTVLDVTRGRIPIIGGATANTPEDRLAAARVLLELGCEAVLASIPYVDDDDYTRQVEALAALGPDLLMLQDWDASGYGLPLPLILDLFERFEAFRSIKIEVAPAGVKYTQVLDATGGRLHVAGGWAIVQMIEALDRGVHALMPTSLHPVYRQILRLYDAGDRAGATTMFRRLLPVLAVSNQHLDLSIHCFKRLVYRQGLYATPNVRQPIQPIDSYQARSIDEAIDLALDLMHETERP